MFDLCNDWRAVFVAVLVFISALIVQMTVDDAITARQKLEKKETVDKLIDLGKEGIQVWKVR